MANKITIKDIARECGVGLGTVSRAINGKPGVKDDVRRKILQYVEDIGWRSNNIYNRLKISDEGQAIVFIAPTSTFERRFNSELLRQLLEEIPNLGHSPVVYYGRCRENLERCIKMKPHAVVVVGVSDYQKQLIEGLIENGIRVIGIGECDDFACPIVFPDYRDGAKRAVILLKKAGHNNIGFFGGMGIRKKLESLEEVNIHMVREMLSGICEADPAFDLETSAVSDCFSDLSILKDKLKSESHSAWICSDEKMYRQFLYCANELGLTIPDDVSLVTFTPDVPFYSFVSDVTRLYPDNSKQLTQIIELLFEDPILQAKRVCTDFILNKGTSVK